jgi:DNA-binding response OmpR family regulator
MGLEARRLMRQREVILLVDSSYEVRLAMRVPLEQHGYNVRSSGSCEGASEILAATPVSLLIADLYSPACGMDVLSELRGKQPPIIGITGFDFLSERQLQAVAAFHGVRTVLRKPVSPSILLKAVSAALSA